MKNVNVKVVIVLLVLSNIIAFFVGFSFNKAPIRIVETKQEIINNKIGEKDAIIKIRKLPEDSLINFLNKYYEKQE